MGAAARGALTWRPARTLQWARLEERSMWDVPPILLYMSLTAAFAALIVAWCAPLLALPCACVAA